MFVQLSRGRRLVSCPPLPLPPLCENASSADPHFLPSFLPFFPFFIASDRRPHFFTPVVPFSSSPSFSRIGRPLSERKVALLAPAHSAVLGAEIALRKGRQKPLSLALTSTSVTSICSEVLCQNSQAITLGINYHEEQRSHPLSSENHPKMFRCPPKNAAYEARFSTNSKDDFCVILVITCNLCQ